MKLCINVVLCTCSPPTDHFVLFMQSSLNLVKIKLPKFEFVHMYMFLWRLSLLASEVLD